MRGLIGAPVTRLARPLALYGDVSTEIKGEDDPASMQPWTTDRPLPFPCFIFVDPGAAPYPLRKGNASP
jgi:hypothetical protein